MPKVSEELRERNRRALVDAARRCADGKPFRDVTVDDVCAEAAVSKGTFYTYFDRKDDLLLAMIEEAREGFEIAADALQRGDASAVDQARRLVRSKLRRSEPASTVQLNADVWSEMLTNDRVRAAFVDSVRGQRARFARLIKEAADKGELVEVPANALAAIFLALSDGLLLHRALDPSGFRWENIDIALDLMLEGLRPKQKRTRRRGPSRD